MGNYIYHYSSPLGVLRIQTSEEYILSIHYTNLNAADMPASNKSCNVEPVQEVCRWLDAYFTGAALNSANMPISFNGTPFQNSVWKHLLEIPYGQTVTYGQIAKVIAQERGTRKMSPQAVGQAVGANPISILVPCHRVIGAKGKLTGYAGGIDRKIWLLSHEQSI